MNQYTWHASTIPNSSPVNVHHVLAYGDLDAIHAIKKDLGEEKIKNIFLDTPQKVYTPSSLNFITKFILHIQHIDETRYLKTTPRTTR